MSTMIAPEREFQPVGGSAPASPGALLRKLLGEGWEPDAAIDETMRRYSLPEPNRPQIERVAERILAEPAPQEATPEPEPVEEPDPLVGRAAELRERQAVLRGERERLSLDALEDPKAKARIAEVEAELASVAIDLERVEMAVEEKDRRVRQAAEEAEAKRVAALEARASKLAGRIDGAARAVDAAAAALAKACATHSTLVGEQRDLLVEADPSRISHIGPAPGVRHAAALLYALKEAGERVASWDSESPGLRPCEPMASE